MSFHPATLAFPDESRRSWYIRLLSLENKNRSRPKPENVQSIREVLIEISQLEGKQGGMLRYEVKVKYDIIDGSVKAKRKDGTTRLVGTDLELFDLVVKVIMNLGHADIRKTFAEIDRNYYGITRQEVEWILSHCSTCAVNKTQTKTAPLKPIITNTLFERVQVDLVDMSNRRDGSFKWICHFKDHFSKYSQAYPLESKHSESVCTALRHWISHLGPPKILQCDNGSEFKGTLFVLLQTHGIQVYQIRSPLSALLVDRKSISLTKLRLLMDVLSIPRARA